jgi:hypothetical protein
VKAGALIAAEIDKRLAGAARAAQEPPYPVAKPTERDRDEGRAVAERLGLLDDARAAQEDGAEFYVRELHEEDK